MEDLAGQGVPSFLQVAHGLDVAAVGLLGGQGADVHRLGDAAVGGDRLAERGGVAVALQHPDDVVGADLAGVDRHDEAQDVMPVRAHAFQVDLAAGEGVQRTVVGVFLDPPAFLVGDVGERGPVLDAEQRDEAEHQVGVRARISDDDVGPLPAVLVEQDVDHVEGVSDGAGHDPGAGPGGLVVDHVEPGHTPFWSEVLAVWAGVDAGDRDDEPHPVDGGDHAAAECLGERDSGLGVDQRRVGQRERLGRQVSRDTCASRSGSSAGTPLFATGA